jgi:hypothetical protein
VFRYSICLLDNDRYQLAVETTPGVVLRHEMEISKLIPTSFLPITILSTEKLLFPKIGRICIGESQVICAVGSDLKAE